MTPSFIHLNVHSEYSLIDGLALLHNNNRLPLPSAIK